MRPETLKAAVRVLDHIPAMVAYWDTARRCVFANRAYLDWFGRTPEEMLGITMSELLGPLYEMNRPFIDAAMAGSVQVFERQIPRPEGGRPRHSVATYIPDLVEGEVVGMFVHVADASSLKERELALERVVQERDQALAEVRVLRGLLPICAHCKAIRTEDGRWSPIETFVSERSDATFSHGICPSCLQQHYPDFVASVDD